MTWSPGRCGFFLRTDLRGAHRGDALQVLPRICLLWVDLNHTSESVSRILELPSHCEHPADQKMRLGAVRDQGNGPLFRSQANVASTNDPASSGLSQRADYFESAANVGNQLGHGIAGGGPPSPESRAARVRISGPVERVRGRCL